MRPRLVGAVAIGAVVAGAAGVVLLRPSSGPLPQPSPGRTAAEACRDVQRFFDVVAANGAAAQALQALDRAVVAARQAAAADPTWIALSGGAESLRVAVRADDRQAASVGTAVVRDQCQQAGAPLSAG